MSRGEYHYRNDYNGGGCPFDADHNVDGGSVDFSMYDAAGLEHGDADPRETVSQEVSCLHCGASWADVYAFARVIVHDGPAKEHLRLGVVHKGTPGDCQVCKEGDANVS